MNSLIIFAETRQKIHHLHHRKIPETSGVSFPSPISITHCRTQLELNLVDTKYWSDQCAISPNHVNTRSKKTGEENAEISQLRGSIKKLMNYQFLKSSFVRNGAFSKENLHFMHFFFSHRRLLCLPATCQNQCLVIGQRTIVKDWNYTDSFCLDDRESVSLLLCLHANTFEQTDSFVVNCE